MIEHLLEITVQLIYNIKHFHFHYVGKLCIHDFFFWNIKIHSKKIVKNNKTIYYIVYLGSILIVRQEIVKYENKNISRLEFV